MSEIYESLRQRALSFGNFDPKTKGPLHEIVGQLPGGFYQQLAPMIALDAAIELDRLRARNEELETAIREYLEAIAPEDWTTEDQMLKDVLENTNADTTP